MTVVDFLIPYFLLPFLLPSLSPVYCHFLSPFPTFLILTPPPPPPKGNWEWIGSHHMERNARTGDTVLVKRMEMTGRTQTTEKYRKTGDPARLPAQLAWRWGQRNWNSVRWGKIYFVLGRLEQPRQNKNPLYRHRQAQRTSQRSAPFICTLCVPKDLNFPNFIIIAPSINFWVVERFCTSKSDGALSISHALQLIHLVFSNMHISLPFAALPFLSITKIILASFLCPYLPA